MSVDMLEREQMNAPTREYGYRSLYAQRVAPEIRPAQDMTPNRMPSYQPQNDYYTQVQSDNINMNVNSYDMYNTIQQDATYFAQGAAYYPYYNDQQYLNNVSASVETRPSNYYQPVQYNDNMYYQASQMGQINQEYERTIPQKSKTKNKTTKVLIAVYFLVVAIAAALIIVNAIVASGAKTATAATVESEAYANDAIYYTVDENGTVSEMAKTEQVIDYTYDTSTNWFDRLCDKLGSFLG